MQNVAFITRLTPEALIAADWELLLAADAAGPAINHLDPAAIVKGLISGEMQCFRLKPGGVLLTELNTDNGCRRLNLVRCAIRPDRSLGWIFPQVTKFLQHLAREWGCEAVESVVYSPRLAKAMAKVGAKPEAVNMVLEV